jgi:hypothetical protein
VVEIFAADSATMTDAAVVLETTVAIEATSEVSARNVQLSGTSLGVSGATATLGGVGGMSARGASRGGGSASLGLSGDLSAHAVLHVNGSARFRSDAMVRLATGDYPVANRSLYHRAHRPTADSRLSVSCMYGVSWATSAGSAFAEVMPGR